MRPASNRATLAFLAIVMVAACVPSVAQNVRIRVLGLFHPREIVIRAAPDSAVVVRAVSGVAASSLVTMTIGVNGRF